MNFPVLYLLIYETSCFGFKVNTKNKFLLFTALYSSIINLRNKDSIFFLEQLDVELSVVILFQNPKWNGFCF